MVGIQLEECTHLSNLNPRILWAGTLRYLRCTVTRQYQFTLWVVGMSSFGYIGLEAVHLIKPQAPYTGSCHSLVPLALPKPPNPLMETDRSLSST